MAGSVLTALITFVATGSPGASVSAGRAVVEVQNKVAVGASDLIEDRTPAYLSVRPEPQCAAARNNCMVPGTSMGSGALLVAVCQTDGKREMVNFNRDADDSADNPNRVGSRRWYGILLPDGRYGLISEVYLTDDSRGGKDLPVCRDR